VSRCLSGPADFEVEESGGSREIALFEAIVVRSADAAQQRSATTGSTRVARRAGT
jgi:hypothetical protein